MPDTPMSDDPRAELEAKLSGLERLRLAGLITEERYAAMRDALYAGASGPAGPPPMPAPPASVHHPAEQPGAAPPPPSPAAAPPAWSPPAPPPAAAVPAWSPAPPAEAPAPLPAPPQPVAATPAWAPAEPPPAPPVPAAPEAPVPPAQPPATPGWSVRPAGAPEAAAPASPGPPGATATPPLGPRDVPRYVPPAERAALEQQQAGAPPPAYPPPPAPGVPMWGAPPKKPATPASRNPYIIGGGIALLIAAAFVAVFALSGNKNHPSSSTSAGISTAAPTLAGTPVVTQHVPMKDLQTQYKAAIDPLNSSWLDLDHAIKAAEAAPCRGCPPGYYDFTPVIPAIERLISAYEGSIDSLSALEALLDGQPSSDVGALVNGVRRSLVAFENVLTENSSSVNSGFAGTMVRANQDVQDLDNVVRKDLGLTPEPPVT